MTEKKNLIQVSEAAYNYLHKLSKEGEYDKSRGMIGVLDIHLFGHYTTAGRGSWAKKSVDKK